MLTARPAGQAGRVRGSMAARSDHSRALPEGSASTKSTLLPARANTRVSQTAEVDRTENAVLQYLRHLRRSADDMLAGGMRRPERDRETRVPVRTLRPIRVPRSGSTARPAHPADRAQMSHHIADQPSRACRHPGCQIS